MLAGCAPLPPAQTGAPAQIRISVTETTAELAGAWKRPFERRHPGVQVVLGTPGPPLASANADLAAFLRWERELAIVSRSLADSDQAIYRKRFGVPARAMPIARGPWKSFGFLDPVVIVVNDANPLRAIGMGPLAALLARAPPRGAARPGDWAALGVPGWSGVPVRIVGGAAWGGEPSARGQIVRDVVLGVAGQGLRDDLGAESGTEAEVPDRVAREAGAIGFTGQGHLVPGEHALAIRIGSRTIAPDCAAVASGRYPLARTVNLYATPAAGRWTRAFARFIRSREGQALIPSAPPWLPLNPSPAELARACSAFGQ